MTQTAVALGNFDGVHKAHAALIRHTVETAQKRGLRSLVYLFEPHPRTLLYPAEPLRLLLPPTRRTQLLRSLGANEVYTEAHTAEVLRLTPAQFAEDILQNTLSAAYVAVGFNYRFGAGAAGDAQLLRSLGKSYGFETDIMEELRYKDAPISSTRIRDCIARGEIADANAMSYAPYTLCGTVAQGKHLGRTLGFPTVNIALDSTLLTPRRGVYVSRTTVDGQTFESVTNIGRNPTVEQAAVRAESHLFGFDKAVYGADCAITLLKFLRAEQTFDTVEALRTQIAKDKEHTVQYFERVE